MRGHAFKKEKSEKLQMGVVANKRRIKNVFNDVQVKDANKRRIYWHLAEIIEIYLEKDKVIRQTKVKTDIGVFHPFQILPLKIDTTNSSSSDNAKQENLSNAIQK